MSDDLIYIEPRQEAALRIDDAVVCCRTVPEAGLAWAQLDVEQKARATIVVGDATYDAWAIRRLRYPSAEAA